MANFRYENGELLLDRGVEDDLMRLINTAAQNRDKEGLRAMGSLMTEPVSTVAAYQEWSNRIFVNKTVMPGEDWAIPLEEYALLGFYSSPDGRIRRTRTGLINVRPSFSTIRSGFEIGWDDLATATWNIVGNKIARTGEEMARKRDALAYTQLQAAANAVGHVVNTTGGLLTRASTDTILKNAKAIGFPIKKVIGNGATFQDMRAASFFTWDSNKFPLAMADSGIANEILKTGYIGNYGDAEWIETNGLSSGTLGTSGLALTSGQAVLWYIGEAPQVGFNVQRGAVRQMSDVNIDTMTNRHMFDESRFFYVANSYAVWQQIITS